MAKPGAPNGLIAIDARFPSARSGSGQGRPWARATVRGQVTQWPTSSLGEDRDPKEAVVALKGEPLLDLDPANPQRVIASVHHGGHGKPDPLAQHTLQVAADHIG